MDSIDLKSFGVSAPSKSAPNAIVFSPERVRKWSICFSISEKVGSFSEQRKSLHKLIPTIPPDFLMWLNWSSVKFLLCLQISLELEWLATIGLLLIEATS